MEDFDLDIFTRMKGKSLDDFRPRLRWLALGVWRVAYLTAEDLVFLKENSRREKDMVDVSALRDILRRPTGGTSAT